MWKGKANLVTSLQKKKKKSKNISQIFRYLEKRFSWRRIFSKIFQEIMGELWIKVKKFLVKFEQFLYKIYEKLNFSSKNYYDKFKIIPKQSNKIWGKKFYWNVRENLRKF